jgi:hypothetical protein
MHKHEKEREDIDELRVKREIIALNFANKLS